MPKDLEKNPFGNIHNEEEEDDDDEEDEDYNPDQANESAGSEIDEDDDIDDDTGSKKKSKKKNNLTTNKESDAEEEPSDQLVKVDEDKITLLWSEFCKDDKKTNDKKEEPPKEEKKVVTKQYDFAGETVTVEEEVTVTKSAEKVANNVSAEGKSNSSTEAAKPSSGRPGFSFKRTGGLSAILGELKKPKMTTLTKSLHDWNDYKKKKNLEEELDQHRRSKDSFMERQAFLGRTDLREFEHEKSIRDHDRKMRQLNSKPN